VAAKHTTEHSSESRPDDFSDSFYYRVMRTIGGALRDQLVPTEPAPERLSNALRALDGPSGGDAGRNDGERVGPVRHPEGEH
jgi:hypothetical protein